MTEKTLRYTTLKGLISKQQQFSLNTFLSGRMHHIKFGWCKFKMTDKLRTEIYNLFSSFLGGINLPYPNTVSYGIFDSLIISKRLRVEYIAGQDYPGEIRYLKKLIRG